MNYTNLNGEYSCLYNDITKVFDESCRFEAHRLDRGMLFPNKHILHSFIGKLFCLIWHSSFILYGYVFNLVIRKVCMNFVYGTLNQISIFLWWNVIYMIHRGSILAIQLYLLCCQNSLYWVNFYCSVYVYARQNW